jgi:hypothetical protein
MSYDSPSYHHIGMNPDGSYSNSSYGRKKGFVRVDREKAKLDVRDFTILLRQARGGDKQAIAELQIRDNQTCRGKE